MNREEAITTLKNYIERITGGMFPGEREILVEAFDALRGPVPNRGEWAVKRFPDEENGERFEMEFFVCSICGNKILWGFMRTDFCSQCGADMRGPCAENRRKEETDYHEHPIGCNRAGNGRNGPERG